MKFRLPGLLFATFLALAATLAHAADKMLIEVVSLKYRTVEEVLPVIRPLLNAGGKISGSHNQLIIRSTPENLRELLPVIQHLDAPARQLILHVIQGETTVTEQRALEVDASLGNRARVEIGAPTERNSIVTRIGAGSGSGSNEAVQRIQTLDGRPAKIRTGKLVPVVTGGVDAHGHPVTQIEHQSVDKGIWVTPRLVGDNEVILEISTRHDDQDAQTGQLQTRRADTTVRGRIGQWIDLGGAADQDRSKERALSGIRRHSTEKDFRLRVRVEKVN